MLDPAIQEMERKWKESGIPDLYSNATGPESRRRAEAVRSRFYPKPTIPVGSITPIAIPGPAGPIPACVVRPKQGKADATIVYFHGGGWIVGDLDSHEAHAARIANICDAVVVNVGYRLAPEHPFPAAPEDAIAATDWVHKHIAEFGGDARKFAVAGDSAGGNLAAVSAIRCRDTGIRLAAQLLLYPATDLRKTVDGDVGRAYLGPDGAAKARNPLASPICAPSLAGLAPAIIGVGIHDFLYQDNLAYAAALKAAGTPVLLREYQTLNHGFYSYTSISEDSRKAAEEISHDLRKLLHD